MFDFALQLVNTLGYIPLIINAFLEGVGVPFPSEIFFIPSAVYTGTYNKFNIILVLIFSIMFSLVGNIIGYKIGKKYGATIAKFLKLKESHIKIFTNYYKKYGLKILFLSKFTPILRSIFPILSGYSKIEFKKYFLTDFIATIVWSMIYLLLGYYGSIDLFMLQYFLNLFIILMFILQGLIVLVTISSYINEYKKKI